MIALEHRTQPGNCTSAIQKSKHRSSMSPTRMKSVSVPFAATVNRYRASLHQILLLAIQLVHRTVGILSNFADLKVGHPNSADYSAWRLHGMLHRAGRLDRDPLAPQPAHCHHSLDQSTLTSSCSCYLVHLPPMGRWPRPSASVSMISTTNSISTTLDSPDALHAPGTFVEVDCSYPSHHGHSVAPF